MKWYLIKLGIFIGSRWNWEVKIREKGELTESLILRVTDIYLKDSIQAYIILKVSYN